ncbi:PIN domain-containing protein [Novosphingobium sp.]|uniref:PIN domain-containing protein n=1 Tax=Novosphingobium sp. TaxID=1874826 RepID=UPI00286DF109|nr:PIN domain-containing protein [Novosphingobium sp.]
MKKPEKAQTDGPQKSPLDLLAIFQLEKSFPDVSTIFESSKVSDVSSSDVLIAVDTNILLLPYTIRKDSLAQIEKFFKDAKSHGRLFLPARVAREFIVNRDRKLAELLQKLSDTKSKINIGENKFSPILDDVAGSDELTAASADLSDAKKKYTKAIEKVIDSVRNWSGNDPVTKIYQSVFTEDTIASPDEDNEALAIEWEIRRLAKIPPGYKDASKDDTGVGDFLVWKSLLKLGNDHNKDIVFITGDEKADWFVRAQGQALYPRPELIAEYRKISGGKNIRIAELHEVLREMEVAQDVVSDVEEAENFQRRNAPENPVSTKRESLNAVAISDLSSASLANFRLTYGGEHVTFASGEAAFTIQISECGPNAVWIYPNRFLKIGQFPDEILSRTHNDQFGFTVSLSNFSLKFNQLFFAKNDDGFLLLARLISNNIPKHGEIFECDFVYSIVPPGARIILP